MAKQYNFKNIRDLLTHGFSDDELRRLCFDVPDFRPIYNQLAKNTGKTDIIQSLLEYVEQKELVDRLLDQAKEHNFAKYKKYQPYYEVIASSATPRDIHSIEETITKHRIQIYLQGDFSSLSVDRKSAAIDAFAAIMGVSPQSIKVYGVYEGSIVFDLGVSSEAIQRLRSLLQSNDTQLRLLKIEKVLLEKESGEIEEWVIKAGKFDLVFSDTHESPKKLGKLWKPKPHREFGNLLSEGIKQLAITRRAPIGIVQDELAEKVGYSANAIHVWRRGEHLPVPQVVEALARIFAQGWQADEAWIKKFLKKGEYEPAKARDALILELFPVPIPPPEISSVKSSLTSASGQSGPRPDLGLGFFLSALQSWNESFFHWSEASDHMRSSWAGMVLYAMSAIAERITPGGALAFFVTLALWLVTVWLLSPALRWPLDDIEARRIAFFKYGVATMLVPLLVALATRPERYKEFHLSTFKQHLTLWFLKFTGALLGFYAFSMLTIGLALAWYYFSMPRLSSEVAAILAIIPLFFSYISARRIPADRYKMFNGNLQAHSVDSFFLIVFIIASPLSAVGLYFGYWFLADKTIAPIIILIGFISMMLWEYKKQAQDNVSDLMFIFVMGFLIPLGLSILAFFFTPGLTWPSLDELPYIFLAISYILSGTLLGATLWVRRTPTLTLPGMLGLLVISILLLLALKINLWLGRALTIALVLIWTLWGRKRFRSYFQLHPSGWVLLVVIGSSLYLWVSALIPLWVNFIGFVLIAASLIVWAYRNPSYQIPPLKGT